MQPTHGINDCWETQQHVTSNRTENDGCKEVNSQKLSESRRRHCRASIVRCHPQGHAAEDLMILLKTCRRILFFQSHMKLIVLKVLQPRPAGRHIRVPLFGKNP